jgi:hypothetical protein
MKLLGIVVLCLGVAGLLIALMMDTTVESGGETVDVAGHPVYVPRSRVHNIGLMEQRRTILMVSGIAVIVGVLFFGLGTLQENRTSSPISSVMQRTRSARRSTAGAKEAEWLDSLQEPTRASDGGAFDNLMHELEER